MRSKVVGNTKRTTEDVDKAKVALEMMEKGEEQIKKGVQTDNQQLVTEGKDLKLKALSIAHFSQRTTAIKRLVGDNWEEKGAFSEETDEKGNRKVKMRDKVGANGEKVLNDKGEIVQEKVESRHQLTTAQKQGLGQEYEFAKKGMRSDIEGIYEVYARAHLLQFDQTHTFIPEWAFGQIINVWKNWGRGTNFVAPLKNADILLDKAIAEDGITTLEIGLGIQEGAWASANNSIYRFIVKEPAKFDLRLPKGMEGGAYQNEWVHGGKTLGGEAEAVINAMSLEDLQKNVANGAIEIKRVTFFGGGKADQSTVTSL
jgi:hypothetical protein